MGSGYQYKTASENPIWPVCEAKSWPFWQEQYMPSWILPFLPGFLKSYLQVWWARIRARVQKILLRYDKLASYLLFFWEPIPRYAQDFDKHSDAEHDAAFGWWRIAGTNCLLLQRETDLTSLCERIALPIAQIEAQLGKRGIQESLADLADNGRLYACDYALLLSAIRVERPGAGRDSRWRDRYLPAPIGVFLADDSAPGGLWPLAIQIDQLDSSDDYNPVYTPADGWGWRIAKAYFETADTTYQAGVGHVFGAHLTMEPFCMATPRQLPTDHCVYMLLRPHLRFTLTANQAAFKYLVKRSELYAQVYAASLEQFRQVIVEGYRQFTFLEREFETDIERRGMNDTPFAFPYRDDLRLWQQPIHNFVGAYIDAFYADDEAVRSDQHLMDWHDELIDPDKGGVRGLVPDNVLDTREKLTNLLAQVIFTAGPGHASQHYSVDILYRYTPQFPGSMRAPPPLPSEPLDFATWLVRLPPLKAAAPQFQSGVFTNYRYDSFGDYDRYPLGQLAQAKQPIAELQKALADIEQTISEREESRLYPYPFVRPSWVPNSTNI